MSFSSICLNRSPTLKRNFENIVRRRSPKITESMRKKYQERIIKDRDKIINQLRSLPLTEDLHKSVSTIIQNSFSEVCQSMDTTSDIPSRMNCSEGYFNLEDELLLEEELDKEFFLAQEEWILKEFEQELSGEVDTSTNTVVLCPICQISYLQTLVDNHITCIKCNVIFSSQMQLHEFGDSILKYTEMHRKLCSRNLQYSAVPDNGLTSNLYISCDKCNGIDIII